MAPHGLPFSFPVAAAPRHASASAPAHISRTYRQASSLFLTRRLPEALTTLAPLITPSSDRSGTAAADADPAPVATASRTTRVKVWSLYLTVLNAVLEMHPEEGKDAFGVAEWRAMRARVRDGTVWEEVATDGYHAVEGDVDPDVVINLSTLLLAHAPNQLVNQRRLESYLASSSSLSSSSAPPLDLDLDFSDTTDTAAAAAAVSDPSHPHPSCRSGGGTSTPRDLATRVKILELYALHVLPRNGEWDYAREFIGASEVLDEERREAFLQALQSLAEAQEDQDRNGREEAVAAAAVAAAAAAAKEEESARRNGEKERQKRQREGEAESMVEATGVLAPPRRPTARTLAASAGPRTVTPGARSSMGLSGLRAALGQLSASLFAANAAALTRLLAFVIGLLVMLGHGRARERVRRVAAAAWGKILATAGMGMRVSRM